MMNKLFLPTAALILPLLISTLASSASLASSAIEVTSNKPITIAQSFNFPSKVMGESREFLVHLPENYHRSGKEYPVLYITDGASGIARMAAITDHLSGFSQRIPQMIVVGIANAGSRFEDLNNNDSSRQFLNFVTTEFQPYINEQYRTNGENLLLGVSLGGQFVVKTLLEQPQAFNAYFSISPYLDNEGYELIERIKTLEDSEQFKDKSLYLSMANEGISQGVDEMAFTLNKHPVKGLKWSFVKTEEEAHSSIFMPQSYAGLQDYYRSFAPVHFKHLKDFEEKGGLAGLQQVYAKRSPAQIPIEILEDVSFFYIDQKRYQEVVELALYNVKSYPTSGRALRNLAESYERIDSVDQAFHTYQRALDVAVTNKHSARSIKIHTENLNKFKKRNHQRISQ